MEDFKREFHCHWLTKWSFAKRLHPAEAEVITMLIDCLQVLSFRVKINNNLLLLKYMFFIFRLENALEENTTRNDLITLWRFSMMTKIGRSLLVLWNQSNSWLKAAVELYANIQRNEDAALWAQALFARDTSPNPEAFMKNHLNVVGDTGGLEQVFL